MTSRITKLKQRKLKGRIWLLVIWVLLMTGFLITDHYFNAQQISAIRQQTLQTAVHRLDSPIHGVTTVTKAELAFIAKDPQKDGHYGSVLLVPVSDVTTVPYHGVRYQLIRTRIINRSRQAVNAKQAYESFSGESFSRQLALTQRVNNLQAADSGFAAEYLSVTDNINNWSLLSHVPAHSETDVITIKLR